MNDFHLVDLSLSDAESLALKARASGSWTLIGALIINDQNQLFAQRRSLTRKFGPGLWDNVGGHVEDDESLRDCLAREISEETGWSLADIIRVIAIRNWSDDRGHSQEYIVIARTTGNLNTPRLEDGKVDRTIWVDTANLSTLDENRGSDKSQSSIYAHALEILNGRTVSR
jgi:8-oxo-dGTP diphosphatase